MKAKLLLLLTLLAVPGSAMAQEVASSLAELSQRQTLRAGDTLWVAYGDGSGNPARDIKVELLALAASSLTVLADSTELVIDEASVRRIAHERIGPLWDGAVRGAAVGAGVGLITYWGFGNLSETAQVTALLAGAGAGIGIGIDALVKEQHIVYLDPRLTRSSLGVQAAPIISRDKKGILFSVRW